MWERAARWSTQLRRECWVATGLSRWNRCSDAQGSGRGRESINPAKMKLCPGCHNLFASGSSTNVCSGCRMRMSHPMQPSYRWNGEAESSWGRVFWKPRRSNNMWLRALMQSNCLYSSLFFEHYNYILLCEWLLEHCIVCLIDGVSCHNAFYLDSTSLRIGALLCSSVVTSGTCW